jgi:hypothetical protein
VKRNRNSVILACVLALVPSIAFANAGSGLIWTYMFHLVFFNTIIGLGESLLICLFFRIRNLKPHIFIAMIAANYASAFVGKWFIESPYFIQITGDLTIENLVPVFWDMVYILFFLTLIVEFPFFVVALYKRKWLIPKAITTTLIVHCISYYLLFHFYGGTHRINMVTECEVVTVEQLQIDEKYDLYYISADGKKVMKSDLNGKNTEIIMELDADEVPDRLFARPTCLEEVQEKGTMGPNDKLKYPCADSDYDLCMIMNNLPGERLNNLPGERLNNLPGERLLLEKFASKASIKIGRRGDYNGSDVTWFNFGTVPKVDCDSEREYWVGFWPGEGIEGGNNNYRYKESYSRFFRFIIDSPVAQWNVRNAAHISGDYAVFQLGKDQICILQPQEKKIALITRGFGPVVAVKHAPVFETIPDTEEPETSPEPIL